MEEAEREIEVRSLSSESIIISISPHKTIQQLKLLLKQSFIPASISPNFHLFFKGTKLSLQSRIFSHSIEPGEFIVLIPYAKKDKLPTQQCDQTETPSEPPNQRSGSEFAESAWSDLMQDLSSWKEISNDEDQSVFTNLEDGNGAEADTCDAHSLGNQHKRKFDDNKPERILDDLMLSILQSPGKNFIDKQNCERLIQVLESVICLSDPNSKECMLFREARSWGGDVALCRDNTTLCLCPPWLKTIMKAFAFFNIFSALRLLQQEEITWSSMKGALDNLGKFGFQIGMRDLEHLFVLCPKEVGIVNKETDGTQQGDALVIINAAPKVTVLGGNSLRSAQKRMSMSKIVRVMKKQELIFKKNLWESVKLLMRRNDIEVAFPFSLEDLLSAAKERGTMANGNEAEGDQGSRSASSSSRSAPIRCHETNPLPPLELIEHLRKGIGSDRQIVHVEEIGARKANHVEIPDGISEPIKSALNRIGVDRLYSHQAESIQASLSGKSVVVATLTSSGKSLCFNLPVLEVLSQDLRACALYLFPTKALAQDQLRALLAMTEGFDVNFNIGVYDGDTSSENRAWLRDNARLLITNPDMLHVSILPFHGEFRRILANLRFIVVDEAHAYKGAFGCHTALIMRRLRRLCSHVYGSDPSFVFCTATSANPREHAMELANLKTVELIQKDGSPSSQKLFVLWNPALCIKSVPKKMQSRMAIGKPTYKKVIAKRSSPILEVSRLFAELVQHGLRSIAFCKSRKLCELVLCYTREVLQETAPHLVDSICAYRAGYIAEDRRRIESDFFGGKLCGIAATNALELGIDVGDIDATLHLGFPGSIASLWQQAGRSGRREKPSLAVYVAFEGPLDQYFMKFPQKLFRSPIECCHIDAKNQQVLRQHLGCAAFEHPLSVLYDEKYFGSGLNGVFTSLENKGYLASDPSRDSSARIWNYIGTENMPSHSVSIRAIETEKYKVIDKQRNEIIEEIEESKAFFQVYEGAVYMNQGKTYLVKDLDLSSKIAICQQADLKYYTKTRDYTDIHVISGDVAYPAMVSQNQMSKTSARAHSCRVTTTWFGFRRIWRGSNRVFDTVDLSLPSFSYESQAVWIRVPQSIKTAVENHQFSFRAGLHAACHALLNVVPLYLICNLSDLAPECANPHDARYSPERILLYDQHPGGSGVSVQVQPFFTELLTASLELLTSCFCSEDTGCPNCIQSLACHEYNELLHKDAAIMIIKGVLEAEKSCFQKLPSFSQTP